MKSLRPPPLPFGLLFFGLSLHLTRSLVSDLNLLSKGVFCCTVVNFLPVGEGATASRTVVLKGSSITLNVTGTPQSWIFVFLVPNSNPSVRVVRRRITDVV